MNKSASLTPNEKDVLINKATELPNTSKYSNTETHGTYLCRMCGTALFRGTDIFNSSCGWPSFDDEINGTITQVPDIDGSRTEIICSRCNGHLGHIFTGEGFTPRNLRYCVNSISLDFVKSTTGIDSEEIILAGGCFWGIEYYLQKLAGVIFTQAGYCGGHAATPNYQVVCSHNTGHREAVRVIFDPTIINLAHLIEYFFEIHDPTQTNGQGPDIGEQYLSAVFCYNQTQKDVITQVSSKLATQGYKVATQIHDMATFWPAEEYHQNYYNKHHETPHCHTYIKRF